MPPKRNTKGAPEDAAPGSVPASPAKMAKKGQGSVLASPAKAKSKKGAKESEEEVEEEPAQTQNPTSLPHLRCISSQFHRLCQGRFLLLDWFLNTKPTHLVCSQKKRLQFTARRAFVKFVQLIHKYLTACGIVPVFL